MTIDEMRELKDSVLISLLSTTTRQNEKEAEDFIKVLHERGYVQNKNGCFVKES